LFGFIPIKKIKVKLLPEEEVFVGGNAIGLSVNVNGALVLSNSILTADGNLANSKYIKTGDIIQKINGVEVCSLDDVRGILENYIDDQAEIEVLRNGKKLVIQVPLLKNQNDEYRLGVFAKDNISGIGTLTFARKNNDFAALGHAVSTDENESIIPISNGEIYSCSQVGIVKGEKNKPGQLQCVFSQKSSKGEIHKNCKYGIYGKFDDLEGVVDGNLRLALGGRLSVRPGKAKIISNVSGISEEYDIEIIKANYQSKSDDKSIVFRVLDKRLLSLTGGIVQGMSGSPILQDGKIVGAVTHVFLSDPTKGYGIYSDWMIEQLNK
jgi:stage IV sporulation protein B